MLQITPNASASQRTKNRLREHSFDRVEETRNVTCFGNGTATPAHLLRCTGCDWIGWLPAAEVTTAQRV